MNELMINITLEEYKRLVEIETKYNMLKAMKSNDDSYLSSNEKIILGISEAESEVQK